MGLNNFYKTKNQFIVSTLFAFGFKIIKTEWQGKECFFVFDNAKKCKELVQQYYTSELKIDPRILFDGFKAIKLMLFNSK